MYAIYEYAGGARSVGRRRSRGAARGGDRERQELLKSRWIKSHGEGAWRLDLDHISRGRHRTGSVFKVPVF
eukprot:scaffold116985_cov84-Phaeocystis_antarctica.AAC.1